MSRWLRDVMVDEGRLVTSPEQLSSWGSGTHLADAVLLDGVVHKTAGPWTPAVFALLRHLEEVGFTGAQRVVGDGYSFVPGESPHPHAWSDEAVGGVGTLLRSLHDATATFTPPAGAVWQPNWLRDLGGEDIVIGHCDPGSWNIVGERGRADAFIDWEFAGPVDRLWELAEAVWLNAQLVDDDIAEMQGLPDAAARARQARAIVDGYGLPRASRDELVDRLSDVAIHDARHEAIAQGVTIDSTAAIAETGIQFSGVLPGARAAHHGSPATARSSAAPCVANGSSGPAGLTRILSAMSFAIEVCPSCQRTLSP